MSIGTIRNIEFVAPRAVSAGELVMDPNTGAWGYARTNYAGGQPGVFTAGSGFVIEVPGAVGAGAPLYCRNGLVVAEPGAPGEPPCAEVISVLERNAQATSALVRLM